MRSLVLPTLADHGTDAFEVARRCDTLRLTNMEMENHLFVEDFMVFTGVMPSTSMLVSQSVLFVVIQLCIRISALVRASKQASLAGLVQSF